ncbi:hypothetical protein PMAYCL1PPCAC_01381, partial [Pristionchus mayeri]
MYFRDSEPSQNPASKNKEKMCFKLYRRRIGEGMELIRTVESKSASKAIFLHRQPYFLQRTGLLLRTYHVHCFEEEKDPIEIDVAGQSLDDCWKVFHRNSLILIRNESGARMERLSKNLIVIG